MRIIAATNRDLKARDREGRVPRGPLLPAQRRRASSSRRCASARGDIARARELLPRPLRAGERQAHRRLHATRRSRSLASYALARQRARARERRSSARSSSATAPQIDVAAPAARSLAPKAAERRRRRSRARRSRTSSATRSCDARGVRRLDVEGGDHPRHQRRARSSTSSTSTRRSAPVRRASAATATATDELSVGASEPSRPRSHRRRQAREDVPRSRSPAKKVEAVRGVSLRRCAAARSSASSVRTAPARRRRSRC